mmetsp:Transcript_78142/g.253008  ORF Transcript_78142/g.253008 Transcript_78142/m.253008 type:complete len:223 (+) Transcript_78142:2088-2756(+)
MQFSAMAWPFSSSVSSQQAMDFCAAWNPSSGDSYMRCMFASACQALASAFLSPASMHRNTAVLAASVASWGLSDIACTLASASCAVACIFLSSSLWKISNASLRGVEASSGLLSSRRTSAAARRMAASPREFFVDLNPSSSFMATSVACAVRPFMRWAPMTMRSVSATPVKSPRCRKRASASSAAFNASSASPSLRWPSATQKSMAASLAPRSRLSSSETPL